MTDNADIGSKKETRGTAIVTGASSGIGAVYAARLAKRGYDLILVARRADKLDAVARTLRTDYGVEVSTIVADLASPKDLSSVVSAINSDDKVTLLVNNAGTATLAPLDNTNVQLIKAMNDINVTALATLSMAAVDAFTKRSHGTLINVGSVLGFFSLPISTVYSGTKGYVEAFTRGLQEELRATNVRVQLVLPASTATELWDVAGVPLSALDQASIMSASDCVEAALAGLDQGEDVTLPSVEDAALLAAYDAARIALFQGSQRGIPASRYTSAK